MAEQVKVRVLRTVPVSDDGIRSRQLVKGTVDVVPAGLFDGLKAEGYVDEPAAGEDGGSPSGGAGQGAGGPVEIPDDWKDLHHATKKKLAREISGQEPADTAAAEAVIEAEIARRTEQPGS
ncbi:hypothetical protein [Ancylobacter mangrovi]|uniref:hypothetical protein n=1 Tax=Ancylobacter mangrovi TaxID=2972472 RepID=UPI002162CC1E|nr:hypothetical protein [Ancylobacter mangrovi]MCS0501616.1 hypothetical protein [Ancylobacter mangrovi]